MIAVGWIALDWEYSRYDYNRWRSEHGKFRTKAIRDLKSSWTKFPDSEGKRESNWSTLSVDEAMDLRGRFPDTAESLPGNERRIAAINKEFGHGPTDDELKTIGKELDRLILAINGVAAYRDHVRSRTFTRAVTLLFLGLLLQAWGSWPSKWTWTHYVDK